MASNQQSAGGGGVFKYISSLRRLERVSLFATAVLLILSFSFIFPITNHKDNAEATVTPSTTTLTLSTSDISAEITPNSANGTFVASDPSTISVVTNNYSGYTLGITSSDNTDNTKLINTDDDSIYLTSISSASTANDFNVGNWGYLPSKLNSVANTNYQPAPTTTATTLEATNAANTNTNEYTIILGAKADYTMPSGTYENTFNIIAVANPVSYSITYDKNTTDTVTNMPSNQIDDTTATSITISNLVPQREDYTFLGWNTASDGTGTTYNPNGDGTNLTYDIDQTAVNSDTLYAQWKRNKIYLQDVTPETCPTEHTLVYDSRDEKTYYIQKIGSLCWMTSNLNIAGGTTLTSAKSNVASDYTLPASSTSGFSDATTAHVYNDNTYGGYYNYIAATAGTNPNSGNAIYDICPKGWRLPTKDNYDTLIYTYTTGDALIDAPWYGVYGGSHRNNSDVDAGLNGYYWSSTANNSTTAYLLDFNSSSASTYSFHKYYGLLTRCVAKNPNTNITFSANGGTGSMANQSLEPGVGSLNSNTFTRSGYVFTGWNTAANGSGTAYSGGATYTGTSTTLYAQWQKLYMQNITTATCPTSRTLVYDSRDEKSYYIQKIGSYCWMTTNLNIAGGTKLTSAKSNVSSDYTLPTSSTSGFNDNNLHHFVYNNSTYGGYYSWVTATAGTKADTYNICPKGWTLPNGDPFNELKTTYSTASALVAAPWYGVYAGSYSNNANSSVDSGGYYWTGSAATADRSRAFAFTKSSNSVTSGTLVPPWVGLSVRCVTK